MGRKFPSSFRLEEFQYADRSDQHQQAYSEVRTNAAIRFDLLQVLFHIWDEGRADERR